MRRFSPGSVKLWYCMSRAQNVVTLVQAKTNASLRKDSRNSHRRARQLVSCLTDSSSSCAFGSNWLWWEIHPSPWGQRKNTVDILSLEGLIPWLFNRNLERTKAHKETSDKMFLQKLIVVYSTWGNKFRQIPKRCSDVPVSVMLLELRTCWPYLTSAFEKQTQEGLSGSLLSPPKPPTKESSLLLPK